MTPTMTINLERALLLLLTLTQSVWMASWIIGRWTQRQEISNVELGRRVAALELKPDATLLERDIKSAHARMDRAGHEMSNLATEVQGIETRMREIFITKELADEYVRESRSDRQQLWQEITRVVQKGGRR